MILRWLQKSSQYAKKTVIYTIQTTFEEEKTIEFMIFAEYMNFNVHSDDKTALKQS